MVSTLLAGTYASLQAATSTAACVAIGLHSTALRQETVLGAENVAAPVQQHACTIAGAFSKI
jgi:hypothetical protein